MEEERWWFWSNGGGGGAGGLRQPWWSPLAAPSITIVGSYTVHGAGGGASGNF